MVVLKGPYSKRIADRARAREPLATAGAAASASGGTNNGGADPALLSQFIATAFADAGSSLDSAPTLDAALTNPNHQPTPTQPHG